LLLKKIRLASLGFRKLDECPHYVKKLSGLSYKVKNEMLRNRNKEEEENGDSDGEHHEL